MVKPDSSRPLSLNIKVSEENQYFTEGLIEWISERKKKNKRDSMMLI